MKTETMSFNVFLSSCLIAISIIMASIFKLSDTKPLWMVICTILPVVAMMLSYKELFRVNIKGWEKLFLFIICLWIWCVLLALIQGAEKPLRFEVLERLIYTLTLTYLFVNLKLPILPLKISLYLILSFFYYQYFVLGITSYGINDSESGAVNTVILLSVAITIQLLDYRDYQRVSILPSLFIVPIAAMSWNRTGFITSILYVMTVFFIGTTSMKKKSKRVFIILFSLLFLSYLAVRYMTWFADSNMYAKFETYELDNTSRYTIWNSYFNSLGIVGVIFGRAIDNSHPLYAGFINPHNSYIMLHSQIGILSVAFLVFVIKRLIQYYRNNKFIFFLFLILILRGFFDMVFFFQPFDYAFLLLAINFKDLACKQQDVKIGFF